MITILPDRLKELSEATIYTGSHSAPNGKLEGCAMEWVSYVAGLPWSDTPPCTDVRLAGLVQKINDGIADATVRTEKMRKLIPLVVNTADHEEEVGELLNRLAIWRLRGPVLSLSETWPESVRAEVVSAIEGVCDALEGGDKSAAESARSAAESAAWSAEADQLIIELGLLSKQLEEASA